MRYMGIDYGTKKVGIAVSDESGRFAFPRQVIPVEQGLSQTIATIARGEEVEALVIGHSKDYNMNDNPLMAQIHAFKERLEKELGLPIHLESELLTSKEAERISGRDELTDARAAALILQSFLDKHTMTP